ncbi:MAG: HAMP domain-containing histidine kinase, partial [Planctomycetota bacterium]|nr:HAMP domain-containing histidine kinase [Planctomycetota bacterium]
SGQLVLQVMEGLILDGDLLEKRMASRHTATLQRYLERLKVDRALLVDRDGGVLLDAGRPWRPGKREPSALELMEERKLIDRARRIAQGEQMVATPKRLDPLMVAPAAKLFRRVGDKYCLALVRSSGAIPDVGIWSLIDQFQKDETLAFVELRDATDRVLTETHGVASGFVQEASGRFEVDGHRFTLRVGVNIAAWERVEQRTKLMPWLLGGALLLAGGIAMALVFRQQQTHLDRERELRARAEQDRRLASLGRLTAGVAHEIKNPLNAVKLSVGRLRRRVDGAEEKPILGAIDASVASITRTVEDFMKLAREPALQRESCELEAVVHDAVGQVAPMADELGRTVRVEGAGAIVSVDHARLREALVNLLRNGLHAARRAVVVSVEADRVHIDDDGSGVPDEQRSTVFDYFYTTREGGTGLGLPLAHRIAEEHGGALTLHDSPLGGARFTLALS